MVNPFLKRQIKLLWEDHRTLPLAICLICLMLAACGRSAYVPITGNLSIPEKTPTPQFSTSSTRTPAPTATRTSFPSSTPSPTITPTLVNPWEYFLGPTQDSEIEITRPVAPIIFPPQTVNIILLGSDRRPNTGGYRTDTLMIVSLDPVAKSAKVISIPRDLYVYIPGWMVNRINTAEPHGGFEMLADTILYNLGIPIQHWARVEFNGAIKAIDLLGGIEIHSTGYLADECGGTYYRYAPNKVYPMDGFTALCYARMRKASSDFDRLRRQQEVFQAVFSKLVSIQGLKRVPELFEIFTDMLQTDIQIKHVLPLVPLAAKLALDPSRIELFRIDQSMVQSWRTPKSGAAVLLPKPDAIQQMLREAFGP